MDTLEKDSLASHRRIFRLLSVLTGRPLAAGEALSSLPSRIPVGPRGERIAVHAAREMDSGRLSLVPQEIANRIYGLAHELRETWILSDVMGYTDRHAAIALDCSRTVVKNRLESVRTYIQPGDVEAIRACMSGLGLPDEFVRAIRDREKARKGIWLLGGMAVGVISLDLLRIWCSS